MDRATMLLKDVALHSSDALPTAAGTVNGTAIDLGNAMSGRGSRQAHCELLLSAPALTTVQLPDAVTSKYSIQGSTLANFASVVPLATTCLTQTGNTGAAAQTWRMKLPSDCPRYVRASVITSTNAGNCAASSMTLDLLF